MSTINKTGITVTSGVPDTKAIPHNAVGKVYVAKQTVDLTGGAITENDIYQVLAIPANTLVRSVELQIVTGGVGTTLTIDVGVTGDNSLLNDVDGKVVARSHTVIGVAEASVQGVLYSTADTIDVTMDVATAITAGPKFTLMAECVDYN